jgi:hypothetical protein
LPFCVEIAPFDGRDLRAFEHIGVHVVAIDLDAAAAIADPFKNLVFFEDVVFLSAALDDRDLAVRLIPVGDRRRLRGGENTDQQRCWNHCCSHEPTNWVPGHEAGNSYFFFFAAGFLAAFLAAVFFAALAIIFVLQFLHRACLHGFQFPTRRRDVGNVVRINSGFKRIFPLTTIENFDR